MLSRKLPQLLDVKDLSTEDVRIAIEMKKDADEKMIMAYLFKHTPLQINFAVNLTCLIPTENPEVGRPGAARPQADPLALPALPPRGRDQAARARAGGAQQAHPHPRRASRRSSTRSTRSSGSIRKSDGKADAAEKIMKRFELDAEQTDAILELKIYRLARLEILIIRNELEEKRKRARQIAALLKDEDSRWKLVRSEHRRDPEDLRQSQGRQAAHHASRATPTSRNTPPDDFIVEEDNVVIVSRRRVGEAAEGSEGPRHDPAARGRLGARRARRQHARDRASSSRNFGVAYTCRFIDVPASTGYGEPIQRLFKLKDGEKIVAALSLDPRAIGDIKPPPKRPDSAAASRTRSPSPATATRCDSASSRSSSRARAPGGATRGRRTGRRWSGWRRSPAKKC